MTPNHEPHQLGIAKEELKSMVCGLKHDNSLEKLLLDMYWKCHICKKSRPDAQISVHKIDIGEYFCQTPGQSWWNVKYCNDNIECTQKAKSLTWKDQL